MALIERNEQIEEMARTLGKGRSQNCDDFVCCAACPSDFCCIFQENAHILIQEGYRKASEVARAVIEDVATLIEDNWNDIQHGSYWLTNGRCTPLRELLKTVEKKYTEVGE